MAMCPDRATLRLYIAEALAGPRQRELDSHIADCPACQEALRGMLPSLPLRRLDATAVAEPPPPGDPDPDDGPPAIPAYVLSDEKLGAGGMAVVWLGHDTRLNRDVAVKVMRHQLSGRPALRWRFMQEAQLASQLQHPAIPPVHEVGALANGRPYFVMKLVKGHTLTELLEGRSCPTADLPRLLAVFERVCQAVGYAHSKGVVHRDLKPSNLMVGAFGEVQVMDWGLAKVRTGAAPPGPPAPGGRPAGSVVETLWSGEEGQQTQAGTVLGTYAYMPPEQARGEVDRLDQRCDVFSLGAILCEVLTGKPPYDGEGRELAALARLGEMGPALARLVACGADEELVGLARSCLGARPEERPADASAVARAVAAYQAGVQERLRKAELERAAAGARAAEERKRRRVQLALAAAVLGLVAAVAGSGLLVQQQAAQRRADQARRDAEQRQGIESALDRAVARRQQTLWRAMRAVLEQARQGGGDAGPADLRRRLDAALAELALVHRLDTIRQRRAMIVEGRLDSRTPVNDYAAAFREAGLGQVGDDPEAVAARVRASAVAGRAGLAGTGRRRLEGRRGSPGRPVAASAVFARAAARSQRCRGGSAAAACGPAPLS
jgi:serine/threonine-protein kinase